MTGKSSKRRKKSDLADVAARRSFILRLRRSGATYDQVLKAAFEHFGVERLPRGYNTLYIAKDVARELERLRRENLEDAEALREIMTGQLDELLLSVWPVATASYSPQKDKKGNIVEPPEFGDRVAAIDRVLKIMERKDKLFGLSASNEKPAQEHRHLVFGLHAQLPAQIGDGSPLLQLSADGLAMVMKLEHELMGGNGHKALPGDVVIDGEFEEEGSET